MNTEQRTWMHDIRAKVILLFAFPYFSYCLLMINNNSYLEVFMDLRRIFVYWKCSLKLIHLKIDREMALPLLISNYNEFYFSL